LAEVVFELCGLQLALNENEEISLVQFNKLEEFAARRIKGEPIARIIGEKEFYSLNFKLNEATLVPRPETEILVDLAIEHIRDIEQPKILDLGTGTGCIVISILANAKTATAIGVDLSEWAIFQAQENALNNGVENRLQFLSGSWFDPIKKQQFDLIISNPPYIKTDDILCLQKEVRSFDPLLALDGGKDGLTPYTLIAKGADEYLKPNGAVMVEFGQGQEKDIKAVFLAAGYNNVRIFDDLAGINRVIVAKK